MSGQFVSKMRIDLSSHVEGVERNVAPNSSNQTRRGRTAHCEFIETKNYVGYRSIHGNSCAALHLQLDVLRTNKTE